MTPTETKKIKILMNKFEDLISSTDRVLSDPTSHIQMKYASFLYYCEDYNDLVQQCEKLLNLPNKSFTRINVEGRNPDDMLPAKQKTFVEIVNNEAKHMRAFLKANTDVAEDEFSNTANFIQTSLRRCIFDEPSAEKTVQDAIETLFIGKGMTKGVDYDREAGELQYSGKKYRPDFILPASDICVEVKLLRANKKSRIIDEINADIPAYSTKYRRLLFIVYDLGVIRDESEFRSGIESNGQNIKVVIVKH